MDDFVTNASHEALLCSLPSDTLLILNKVSLGMSDKEIVAWSSNWSFTEEKIKKSLILAYEKLGLKTLKPTLESRNALCEFMAECRQNGLLTPKASNGNTGEATTAPETNKETHMSRVRVKKEIKFNEIDINSKVFKKILHFNIKFIAKSRGLTMDAVARGIGWHAVSISNLSSGVAGMNVSVLFLSEKSLRFVQCFLQE